MDFYFLSAYSCLFISLQLSSEAKKVLVESYVTLRRGDSTPGTRVAYRMTVRQLEALIRLSEAIARSHLERTVSILIHLHFLGHVFFYHCSIWSDGINCNHLDYHGQYDQLRFGCYAPYRDLFVHLHDCVTNFIWY